MQKIWRFDGYQEINDKNKQDYCKFLLNHKGKLHNTFSNAYHFYLSYIKSVADGTNTDNYQITMLSLVRFSLRCKYDKNLIKLQNENNKFKIK